MSTTGAVERAAVAKRVSRLRGLSLRPLSDTTGVREAMARAIDEGRTADAKALLPRFDAMVRERQRRRDREADTDDG